MWLPAIALDSSQYRSFEPMSSDSKTSNFSIIYCLLSVHRRFRHQGKRWWEGRTNHSKEIIQTICCFESIRREKLKKQKTPEFVRPSLRYLIVISTILSIINKLNMGFYSVSEQVTKPTCAHVISYNFDDPPSLKAKQLSCLCLILISPNVLCLCLTQCLCLILISPNFNLPMFSPLLKLLLLAWMRVPSQYYSALEERIQLTGD